MAVGPARGLTAGAATAAIVRGEVLHHRLRPRVHRFRYPVFFLRLPLSALERLGCRWLAIDRPGPISFWRRDHGARDGSSLEAWMRARLAQAGLAADGEIVLYTFPRLFGYVFNPVSFWFCHDRDGRVRAVLAEVNNTYGERHDYLLARHDGAPIGRGAVLDAAKRLHVSPFFPVRGRYAFRLYAGERRSAFRIDYLEDGEPSLITAISGTVEALDDRNLLGAWLRHPLMTFLIIARIHWHALRLWLKGIRVHSKPAPPAQETTR
jgi:DUF1365 family protein